MFRYQRLGPNSPPKFAVTVSDGILEDGPRRAKILFNAEPMEIWRHHHFSIEELADPNLGASLWGDFADADGDGKKNLIEYALGTNPRSTVIEDDGLTIGYEEESMVLTYRKILGRTDIIYQVQASSDLKTWIDTPDELLEARAEVEIRRVSIPLATGEENFLRLKVSR